MIQKWLTLMTKENTNWPQIPDHLYRILIIRGSASGKKSLFNLVSQQLYIHSRN